MYFGSKEFMKIPPERKAMLATYRRLAGSLIRYLNNVKPWNVNTQEVEAWINKIGFELEAAPYAGLVVRTPPPPHIPFNLYIDIELEEEVRPQSRAFCDWFSTMREIEVQNPAEGEVGYRITEIRSTCKAERVTFLGGVWLSDEEITEQATTQKCSNKKEVSYERESEIAS